MEFKMCYFSQRKIFFRWQKVFFFLIMTKLKQHPNFFSRFFEFWFFPGNRRFLLKKVIPFFEILAKPQYKLLFRFQFLTTKVEKLVFYREKSKNSKNLKKNLMLLWSWFEKKKISPTKKYFSLWEIAYLKSHKLICITWNKFIEKILCLHEKYGSQNFQRYAIFQNSTILRWCSGFWT